MNTTEAFKVQEPDYALSPYTGMTRKHWIEAGKYLLKGLFDNLDSIDSPPLVPRTEKSFCRKQNISQPFLSPSNRISIIISCSISFFHLSQMLRSSIISKHSSRTTSSLLSLNTTCTNAFCNTFMSSRISFCPISFIMDEPSKRSGLNSPNSFSNISRLECGMLQKSVISL